MTWWFAVVESRHELQNPTSRAKLLELGARLGLGPESRVLDVGSGRGGPAILLASEHGCRVTCIESSPDFAAAARARVADAGLADRIEILQAAAADVPLEPEAYDAALCLGASFAYGGLRETVDALVPAVRPRGFVVVGEPYLRAEKPFDGFLSLAETVERFESGGVSLVSLIASSEDDWDRYESLHWLVFEEWLAANPDHPQAEEFRARDRESRGRYLREQRGRLAWAILVGRR
jgi:SAM-dependent methyltransferase